jgi:arylformamidase
MNGTRRTFLAGAVAAAVAAARPIAGSQLQTRLPPGVTPGPKGPPVFLDYDQAELDAAYDQAPWAPNQQAIAKRGAQKNAAALARLGRPRRFAYGPTPIEQLDLFPTSRPNAPINVFIHGGAWRAGSAAGAAHMAELFVDRGAHFISLDFNNVIETKGSLLTMADQVRRGVAWVYRHATSFDGDASRLHVSGVSSGAHLAAVVLTTDWQTSYGLPAGIVKGGLCCSGMYDLHPVSLSARGKYVNFTRETVQALSPLRHLAHLVAPVIVACGTLETPEFQRQARAFADAVEAAGKPVTLLVGDGYNHFELPETIGNPYGLLGRAVLEQMKLTTS